MLIKFFVGGKKYNAPKNAMDYLLRQQAKHTENDRKNIKILKGNPQKSVDLASSLEFAQQYKMGCLSFEEANINDTIKQQIMADFEQMVFAGMQEEQYDICWVEHTDKGRLELNFFIPQVELTTGKRFQTYYARADQKRFRAWQDITNQEYKFTDPNDPTKRQTLAKSDKRVSKKATDLKEQYANKVKELYSTGQIKNRDELVRYFEQNGYSVPRQGKDYITIITPQKNRLRLKGALFEPQFIAEPLQKQSSTLHYKRL